MNEKKFLSVGMSFCDIPLRPTPADIMKQDSVVIDPVEFHTGGDALTVAVVLAKMGGDVTFVTNVGDDEHGHFILAELEKNGVRTDCVRTLKGWTTATSYQLIEADGQRHFLVDNKINSLQKSKDAADEVISKADMVFFGSALAIKGMDDGEIADLFKRAHSLGKITAMDAAVCDPDEEDRKMDLLKKTLPHTDIFIPSYEEASYLAMKTDVMEIINEFRQFPFKVFGVKLGAEGCILTSDFEQFVRVRPYPVKVVDTTGAGDCFMGGFLSAYMKGWSLEKCAEFGSAVAAFGISAIGPSTAVPDYETICRFMQENEKGKN